MTGLPEVVARNVRDLRVKRGWSQRQLAERLDQLGGKWSRVAVTALESQGKRGRDVLDLATLCWALQVDLNELLAGEDNIDLPSGETVPLERVRGAMLGPEIGAEPRNTEIVGSPLPMIYFDQEEETRIARKLDLDADQLSDATMAVFGRSGFLRVRDAQAGVDEDTPPRRAQALRGHATRRLLAEIEQAFEAEGREQVLKRGEQLGSAAATRFFASIGASFEPPKKRDR